MYVVENFNSRLPDIGFLKGKPAKGHMLCLVKLNALLDKDAHLSKIQRALFGRATETTFALGRSTPGGIRPTG